MVHFTFCFFAFMVQLRLFKVFCASNFLAGDGLPILSPFKCINSKTFIKSAGGGDGTAHSDIPDIVFPSDRPSNHDMIPMITDKGKGCARGTTFCEKVDGYPKDFLATILQKEARKYMDLFGEDQVKKKTVRIILNF